MSVFESTAEAGARDIVIPVPAMRLDQVQAFIVLAEELHFTHAAERLFLSQPGLSRRVAGLEATLGHRLLLRTSRRVQLTAAGRSFLPYAQALVEHTRLAVATLPLARHLDPSEL